MKPKDVQNAVPAVSAVGVPDSIQMDGSYGEYDVQISVAFSPAKGQQVWAANKVVRMTAKEFAAFREKTNLWDGKKFLQEEFADKWEEVQKQAEEAQRPTTVVYNQFTGAPTDGQPVVSTWNPAQSSVAVNLVSPTQEKPEVTTAPEVPVAEDYVAPANGPEADFEAGNVPVFAYEANETSDFKTPENVKEVEKDEPSNPEQTEEAQPEQAGSDVPEDVPATKEKTVAKKSKK